MKTATEQPSLCRRILAVLREAPLSVSTPDLIALTATGVSNARAQVWVQLIALERAGVVVKVTSKNGRNLRGRRPVRWALA